MRDFTRYWQEVRAIQAGLSAFVWLVSLENPVHGWVGGVIVEAAAALAAQWLYAKSHRLATEEEIREHKVKEETSNRAAAEERLRRRGVAVVPVGTEE